MAGRTAQTDQGRELKRKRLHARITAEMLRQKKSLGEEFSFSIKRMAKDAQAAPYADILADLVGMKLVEEVEASTPPNPSAHKFGKPGVYKLLELGDVKLLEEIRPLPPRYSVSRKRKDRVAPEASVEAVETYSAPQVGIQAYSGIMKRETVLEDASSFSSDELASIATCACTHEEMPSEVVEATQATETTFGVDALDQGVVSFPKMDIVEKLNPFPDLTTLKEIFEQERTRETQQVPQVQPRSSSSTDTASIASLMRTAAMQIEEYPILQREIGRMQSEVAHLQERIRIQRRELTDKTGELAKAVEEAKFYETEALKSQEKCARIKEFLQADVFPLLEALTVSKDDSKIYQGLVDKALELVNLTPRRVADIFKASREMFAKLL